MLGDGKREKNAKSTLIINLLSLFRNITYIFDIKRLVSRNYLPFIFKFFNLLTISHIFLSPIFYAYLYIHFLISIRL